MSLFTSMLRTLILSALVLIATSSLAEPQPAPVRDSAPPDPAPNISSLHQWAVGRMLSWSPPGRSFIKDAKETPEEGKIRYEQIAGSAIAVAYDPAEKPLFGGSYGRGMTLALLLSVSWFESGYRKDVDLGAGPHSRGDKGKSWCLSQIMMGVADPHGRTRTRVVMDGSGYRFVQDRTFGVGWGGEDLVRDREKCYRTGLRLMRSSFAACRRQPVDERLAAYAGGDCRKRDAIEKSRVRVRAAQRWLSRSRPPLEDRVVLQLLFPPSGAPSGPSGEKDGLALLSPPPSSGSEPGYLAPVPEVW